MNHRGRRTRASKFTPRPHNQMVTLSHHRHTNIYPQFTVTDMAKAKPFMDRCVVETAKEPGCIYYGAAPSLARPRRASAAVVLTRGVACCAKVVTRATFPSPKNAGWTVSEDGTKMMCRETYVDGAAASAHLVAAVPIVGEMLDSGAVARGLTTPSDPGSLARRTA